MAIMAEKLYVKWGRFSSGWLKICTGNDANLKKIWFLHLQYKWIAFWNCNSHPPPEGCMTLKCIQRKILSFQSSASVYFFLYYLCAPSTSRHLDSFTIFFRRIKKISYKWCAQNVGLEFFHFSIQFVCRCQPQIEIQAKQVYYWFYVWSDYDCSVS